MSFHYGLAQQIGTLQTILTKPHEVHFQGEHPEVTANLTREG